MKKVYVIGVGGTGQAAIETARRILKFKEDTEIICVDKMEDVPLEYQIKSDLSVRQIHKITAPIIPEILFELPKEKKSHKRPYKYHR